MAEINITEIAQGNIRPMTLEERVTKAIENISKALETMDPRALDRLVSLSGREYLDNQRKLLLNLLESTSWE